MPSTIVGPRVGAFFAPTHGTPTNSWPRSNQTGADPFISFRGYVSDLACGRREPGFRGGFIATRATSWPLQHLALIGQTRIFAVIIHISSTPQRQSMSTSLVAAVNQRNQVPHSS